MTFRSRNSLRNSGPRVMSDVRRRPPGQPLERRVVTANRQPSSLTNARVAPRPQIAPPTPRQQAKAPRRLKIRMLLVPIAIIFVFNMLLSHRSITRKARLVVVTKPQTVCLDPGHGGDDPGANNQNTTERDINLTVAMRVQALLQKQGYKVYMTRTSNDPTLVNADRYHFCNSHNATIMVSIHHNYFTDSSVDYDQSLYFKPQDLNLAESIVNSTSSKLGLSNDGVASFEDGVLSESNMPAALSEGFFITNSGEYAKLTAAGSTRLSDEADGITTGIVNYFEGPKPTPTPAGAIAPPVLNRSD